MKLRMRTKAKMSNQMLCQANFAADNLIRSSARQWWIFSLISDELNLTKKHHGFIIMIYLQIHLPALTSSSNDSLFRDSFRLIKPGGTIVVMQA